MALRLNRFPTNLVPALAFGKQPAQLFSLQISVEASSERSQDCLTMEQLSLANTQFAVDLFRTLKDNNPSGNIFFSPISISSALAMRHYRSQMSKTLHFDAVKKIHSSFQSLNSDIHKRGAPYILKLANRLYGEKTYEFLPEFLASTQKMYGAELASVDFQRVSEGARKVINEWVKGQTEGKIPELLAAGVVDNMTKLVLVNAIYFKGNWQEKFSKMATIDTPFKLNKKDTKRDLKCRVLELPYQGRELSMVILLPDDIEDEAMGLKKIEDQLTLEKLREWTKPENLSSIEVNVYLPRFKLEENYNLNSHLASLGIEDLFTSRADLSGMSRAGGLFISKIVHKSFVEVNEEGTEAAAATAGIATFCMLTPEENFVADHPLFFSFDTIPQLTSFFRAEESGVQDFADRLFNQLFVLFAILRKLSVELFVG
ncbi:hypothetical protein QTO34_002293, partial [Cnephaeus nilssonii]